MMVSETCPREPTGSGLQFSVSPLSSPGMLVLSVSLRVYAFSISGRLLLLLGCSKV